MDGVRLPGIWAGEACPNPFRTAPSPFLVKAQKYFDAPAGFNGRIGALVFEKDGALYAQYAIKPNRTLPSDWRDLTPNLLWPSVSFYDISDAELFSSDGTPFSFRAFLTKQLNAYSAKDIFHGGKKLAWLKGQMLFAMREALTSPSILLVNAFNRNRRGEHLVAFGEWHVGHAESHDIRFNQTFYAPFSSEKELLFRLLDGIALVSPIEKSISRIPILYEDNDLLVVCKPAKLACVPSVTERNNCLSLLARKHGPLYDIHRLDMATSGVIAYAKNRETQSEMQKAFRARKVAKSYVALLDGALEIASGTVCLPLGVNRLDRPRQCVLPISAGGKEAVTHFEVLEKRVLPTGDTGTLVRLIPHTGKTHQLRVHCAHKSGLATPIFGDVFYGRDGQAAETGSRRLCLHAERLSFLHPITGKLIEIISESDF